MIALDTNVLVRIFIDDENKDQVKKARELAEKVRKVFVPQVVQVELAWVLLRAFKINKDQVLQILDELHLNAAFVLQNEEDFLKALDLYRSNAVDFSDCLILIASNRDEKRKIYTFDKKFSSLEGVELIH